VGTDFIGGTFGNLNQGQNVVLSYGGTNYNFVANYFGGSGNDLVLTWAQNRVFGWGRNNAGQVGDGSTVSRSAPVRVSTGVLAGKTVMSVVAGDQYSLALCSDGTVAAWGDNTYGQIGDNTTTQRKVPVAVNVAPGVSALFGKTVVAVAVGRAHSLALCSDGTVAAWGINTAGEVGDNTTSQRNVPVAVNAAPGVSALYGKRAVRIYAGGEHSMALCSDGTVVSWGYNYNGALGNNSTANSSVPVAVATNSGVSALYGKTVVAVATGYYHTLALCSDGTLVAWGDDYYVEIGDGSTGTNHFATPVLVNTNSGVSALYGKTVVGIAAGYYHSLALCSDGSVAGWGYDDRGQVGDNGHFLAINVPVAVDTTPGVSALYGKTVVDIAACYEYSVALCADGTMAAWGVDLDGQLGGGFQTLNIKEALAVSMSTFGTGQRFSRLYRGASASHTLAIVTGPSGGASTLTGPVGATNGSVQFSFSNTAGAFFGVVAATNFALPLSSWTPVGDAIEISPGQFQFTDLQATNYPQRFYRVRTP
jgi:alpha-tubulin suppressor-like RCC1 family protein